MRKLKDVLQLYPFGLSQHEIARSFSLCQSTVTDTASESLACPGHNAMHRSRPSRQMMVTCIYVDLQFGNGVCFARRQS